MQIESGWLNATRTFVTSGRIDLCCSMRSNIAVFIPWIDDAEGHRRSAICSSSQRFPRSAVTASGRPPFGVDVEQTAILRGQKFARGEKILLRQQRRHQTGERAAALVKFHRRCSPCCKGAGGLAAGETECLGHGLGIERRSRPTAAAAPNGPRYPRAVPALGPERRIITPSPIRVVTSHPAAMATSRSRPDSRRARQWPKRGE